jgi:hypothetical protein
VNTEEARVPQASQATQHSGVPHLSNQDIDRLTNYKWRYSLESHGFSSDQADRLLFLKWLYRHGAVRS